MLLSAGKHDLSMVVARRPAGSALLREGGSNERSELTNVQSFNQSDSDPSYFWKRT